MPDVPAAPGVVVQEPPAGRGTIIGVATSITAFVGRAARGPDEVPTTITGFADFARTFGGLWAGSALGPAVRDFFANGGEQAVIVRLVGGSTSAAEPAPAVLARLDVGGLPLEAASKGAWGGDLRATIDRHVTEAAAAALGVAKGDVFNLTVHEVDGTSERHDAVTVVESARRIDRVLLSSQRVRYRGTLDPAAPPTIATSDAFATATAASDGPDLVARDFVPDGGIGSRRGLYALEGADLFNLLCIPPYRHVDAASSDAEPTVVAAAVAYCERRRAICLVDPPSAWRTKDDAKTHVETFLPTRSAHAALYFPRIRATNPLAGDRVETYAPCGAVAGVIARTDTRRGVWKAPAGLDANLAGITGLDVDLNDAGNAELNALGINALRTFPVAGRVVWGARTLRGADALADPWKYLPVRRLALYVEESVDRGLRWAAFEPNGEALWSQIRASVGAFLNALFREGAFQGATPRDAYFVNFDASTTTVADVDRGVVHVHVGFAPLKPAEFVVSRLELAAGRNVS